jgi:hypothetical protein
MNSRGNGEHCLLVACRQRVALSGPRQISFYTWSYAHGGEVVQRSIRHDSGGFVTTPRCGLLFHFTHVDNLASIVKLGALQSDALVRENSSLANEAGEPSIKERRRSAAVSCHPFGFVGDYVPFYFAARSPMMYVISRGRVPTFRGEQQDLVYMVSSVEKIVEAGLPFVVSDRNAAVKFAEFSNDVSVLGDLTSPDPQSNFVDWQLMKQLQWQDTAESPDRMERRMAELLVHHQVPLDLMVGCAVSTESLRGRVERLFVEAELSLPVVVRSNWYYA